MNKTTIEFADFSWNPLTGHKYRPERTWHEGIKHDRIYFKRNYIAYFPELQETIPAQGL